MTLARRYLLDVNVLIALSSDEHVHHRKAHQWLHSIQRERWGICPFTEAGYLRFTTNPVRNSHVSFAEAIDVLDEITKQPGYSYWPITESWTALTAPFASRIFGHQQITDACLLGLAIKEDGVLVTFDRGLKYMAGAEFARNLQVIE
jgi:toxin-antitoxin system PIN domain toxin